MLLSVFSLHTKKHGDLEQVSLHLCQHCGDVVSFGCRWEHASASIGGCCHLKEWKNVCLLWKHWLQKERGGVLKTNSERCPQKKEEMNVRDIAASRVATTAHTPLWHDSASIVSRLSGKATAVQHFSVCMEDNQQTRVMMVRPGNRESW